MSTRFHFACAIVRMQSHARMLQPSSSGVIHAYVKERARDGTGTAAAARARLHTRNARTGTHGTGCTCRSFHELVGLRRFAERQRVRRAIRRVTCRKTRSSEPSPVFLNTTLSRERPQTLATRPARQAPIRCPRARTQLRALYVNPSFPFIRRTNPDIGLCFLQKVGESTNPGQPIDL